MKICAATGNAGKLRELRRILEAQGHEVVSQKELGITIEPDETGTTFEANALIKAETICKASGLPTIADDSGLCVDALDGAPGVYSARYCGHHGDDEANNDKLGRTDKRPNSEGRSYAQLTPDEKDAISHRGNALAEMEKELPEFLKKAE